MTDPHKTRRDLVNEVRELQQRVAELQTSEAEPQRTDAALRESEERYRSLTDDVLETSGVGMFILDKDFRVVWVNEALERYFGLRRDEVIGRDKRELIRQRIKHTLEDPEAFAEKVLATYDDNSYVENFECTSQSFRDVPGMRQGTTESSRRPCATQQGAFRRQ